jgi:Uma2 family endonuclease
MHENVGMAATTSPTLTIDDFENLPLEQVRNCELINGELVPVSGNTPQHNIIRDLLIAILHPIMRRSQLGMVIAEQEFDFKGNAHAPDVSFFGPAKQASLNLRKRVQRFVPDLAIEIVSESDTFAAVGAKKDRYRKCGVQEVWIVWPDTQEVLVYSDRGDHILSGEAELSTELIPGFRISVRELFASE